MIDATGRALAGALGWTREVSLFGARAITDAFRPPYELREVLRQVFELGWRSAPLLAVSGLAVGVVLSMPMGSKPPANERTPAGETWEGVALAIFVDPRATP
jgi:ABC-type transporter Mla maintaining outer membrane lipid asymmetry permease subunit MlaE